MNWLAYIILALGSIIPVLHTYGRVKIGGDVIIPIIPENAMQMTYEWLATANGLYASTDYLQWIGSFLALQWLGLDLYQAAFVYQFLIFFLSGLGVYKIYRLYDSDQHLFATLAGLFFIYSPHLLDHMIYFQGTVCIVWSAYFLIKFITSKKFSIFDAVRISIIAGFIGNIPNPKYHFFIIVMYIVGILLAILLKLLTPKDLIKSARNFLLVFILTTYIWLPYIFFGYTFATNPATNVRIRQGYQSTGLAIDYGGALVSKMITLFHTPNLNPSDIEIVHSPLFTNVYYVIALSVLVGIWIPIRSLPEKKRRLVLIFYGLALFFIFISKSSNPPFGFIYDRLLTSVKVLAFIRTSAGFVIYAGVFYALIFGVLSQWLYEKTRKPVAILVPIVIITIAGFPFWSGKFFLNQSAINPFLDKTNHGFRIPQGYLEAAAFLDRLKIDTKISVYPYLSGYQNNTWGYYGFVIYPWFLKQHIVTGDVNNMPPTVFNNTNVLYALHDKTSYLGTDIPNIYIYKNHTRLFTSPDVDIYRRPLDEYAPHFFVPKKIQIVNSIPDNFYENQPLTDTATYMVNENKEKLQNLPKEILSRPIIEYKAINPTKYRVRIHDATDTFTIIFTDNFHKYWRVYANEYSTNNTSGAAGAYQMFPHNSGDQASIQEVEEFIANKWITDFDPKQQKFISKSFHNTIQNDYMASGPWYETWFLTPITHRLDHLTANGYANSWTIDTTKLCEKETLCIKQIDGTYDMELIVEFFPQQLAYLGRTISFSLLIGILLNTGIYYLLQKRRNLS